MTSSRRAASLLLLLSPLLAPVAPAQGWTTSDGSTLPAPEGAALGAVGDPGEVADALVEEALPPGGTGLALVVLRDGEPVYAVARGLADLEHGVPCDAHTVFDMASLAKSVTAAAAATLVEKGALALDARVRELLPELSEAYAPVRVEQLVHHTAGVEDEDGTLALAGWPERSQPSFGDAVRLVGGLEHLRFAPGTRHEYTNGGYLLLAAAVERAAGEPLPAWAARCLFAPLGMTSARLVAAADELVPARAVGYALEDGRPVARTPSAHAGAGGFLCSVTDLARWGEALRLGQGRTGAGLGERVAERMRSRGRLADGTQLDYAFGLGRSGTGERTCWAHAGTWPGGQSALAFWPEAGLVVAAASNSIEGGNVRALVGRVADLWLGPPAKPEPSLAARGMVFIDQAQERPAASRAAADPARLAALEGVWEMEDGITLLLAREGERLLVGFSSEPSIELFPLTGGGFVLSSVGYELALDPDDRDVLRLRRPAAGPRPASEVVGRRWRPAPLDAAAAARIAGDYRSDALGASYRVAWRAGELWLEHPCHGVLRMRPAGTDAYTLAGALARLTLVRGADGSVAGFELEARSWSARARFTRT